MDALFLAFRDEGEETAFEELFAALAPRLLRRAITLTPTSVEAQDLVQVTFLTAIEKGHRYDSERPFERWLFGILRLEAASEGRRASRRSVGTDGSRATSVEPWRELLEAEQRETILTALEGLPARYKRPLRELLVEGKSPQQIARELRANPSTVRVQLHRGLELLRAALPAGFASGFVLAFLLDPCLGRAWANVSARAKSHLRPSVSGRSRRASDGPHLPLRSSLYVAVLALVVASSLTLLIASSVKQDDMGSPSLPITGTTRDQTNLVASAMRPLPSLETTDSRASRSPVESVPRGTTFFGRVLDLQGRPVPGADIEAYFPHAQPVYGEAGSDGEFAIEIPSPGGFESEGGIVARDEHGNARGVTYRFERYQSGSGVDAGVVCMSPGRSLVVQAKQGERPVAGALIVAEVGMDRRFAGVARTDPAGTARFVSVAGGVLLLRTLVPGGEGRHILRPGESNQVEIEIRPLREIDVRVVDEDTGEGIGGIQLRVQENVWDWSTRIFDPWPPRTFTREERFLPIEVAPTDAKGFTRIAGIPEQGRYSIVLDDRYSGSVRDYAAASASVPSHGGCALLELIRKDQPTRPTASDEFAERDRGDLLLRFRNGGLPIRWSGLDGDVNVNATVAVRVVERRPAVGEVLLCLSELMTDEVTLRVDLPGYRPKRVQVHAPDGILPHAVDVELESAAAIAVTVLPPSSSTGVDLQRWRPGSRTWGPTMQRSSLYAPNASDGTYCFEGLTAGRYRARTSRTGVISEPIEVVDDQGWVATTIRLGGVCRVQGRVVVPLGYTLGDVRVCAEVDGVDRSPSPLNTLAVPSGVQVDSEGTFSLSLPADSLARLHAWHPLLVPAPGKESVLLAGDDRDEVQLELVRGAEVVLPVTSLAGRLTSKWARLLLFEDEAVGVPAVRSAALFWGDSLRFVVPEAGRWTAWLDLERAQPGLAPLILEGMQIGEGANVLDEPSLSPGSSIRLSVPRGETLPPVYASARKLGMPSYLRCVQGETGVVVGGLGAGTFEVAVFDLATLDVLLRETVEVDGLTDVDLVLGRR